MQRLEEGDLENEEMMNFENDSSVINVGTYDAESESRGSLMY
jgi:hypothetical protein